MNPNETILPALQAITKGTALEGMYDKPAQCVRTIPAVPLVEQQAARIRNLERRCRSLSYTIDTLEKSADFQLPEVEMTDRHPSGDPTLESWHQADPALVAKACDALIQSALDDGSLEEAIAELENKSA